MNESEDRLRTALSSAQAAKEAGRVPAFDEVWAGAQQRTRSRRRRMLVASAAVLVLGFVMLMPPGDDGRYINSAELLETTSWTAPSDSLLPEHPIDLYGDMPVLVDPANTYGGTLL